jgi:hypothetical protein
VAGAWGEPLALRVINNHWKSKAGDEAVNAPRRRAQAEFVASLAQAELTRNPAAAVIVLGDLNDYLASEPVETLRTATEPDLEQAYDWLPRLERYSYIFNGASQALDHLLFSPNLLPGLAEVNIVRVSADYATPAVDDPASYLHASDHDPIVARFRPAGAAWLGGNLRFPGIALAVTDAAGARSGQRDHRRQRRLSALAPARGNAVDADPHRARAPRVGRNHGAIGSAPRRQRLFDPTHSRCRASRRRSDPGHSSTRCGALDGQRGASDHLLARSAVHETCLSVLAGTRRADEPVDRQAQHAV